MKGKEKVRNIILNLSVFYVLVVSALVIFNIATAVDSVELNDSEENLKRIEELRLANNNLNQDECTNVINDMIKQYVNTSYAGETKLSEIYNYTNNNSFLNFYMDVKDACEISDERSKELKLPTLFVTAVVQQDELIQTYMYQYELKISDAITRMVLEPSLVNVEYTIRKNTELDIIAKLVEHATERNGVNE